MEIYASEVPVQHGAIVEKIAEVPVENKMLEIDSELGKGTTFNVYLNQNLHLS